MNETLQNTQAAAPGTDPAAEGAAWQFEATWGWPVWATLLLILLLIAWVAYFYVRETGTAGRLYRTGLALLRLGALAVLLVMLAEIGMSFQQTGPASVAVIIDRSASMHTVDRYADPQQQQELREAMAELAAEAAQSDSPQANSDPSTIDPTRLEVASLVLTADEGRLLRHLAEHYSLNVYFADEGIERQTGDVDEQLESIRQLAAASGATVQQPSPGTPAAATAGTRLGAALRRVLRDQAGEHLTAVILLSDGINTDGPTLADVAPEARRQLVRLLTVGIGDDVPPRDIEVTSLLVDDVVFAEDLVRFQSTIRASGLAGETLSVVLRQEGESTPLAEQRITPDSNRATLTVQLNHRPAEPGDVAFVVEAVPYEGEIDLDNNRRTRVVSVRDEKIRTLLAFSVPSYEYRYLKTVLERDKTVELSTYLQEADPEHARQEATAIESFPIGREELSQYDVLVLGDLNPSLLPRAAWEGVVAFVEEQGGGLVLVAGERYFPTFYRGLEQIALLSPVDLTQAAAPLLAGRATDPYRVEPTPLGLRTAPFQLGDSPAGTEEMFDELPALYWLANCGPAKPAAQVLATPGERTGPDGRPQPLFALQYFGKGTVLLHATDETWRWRFRRGDADFARYWVQTMRFLARGKLASRSGVELTVDRQEYQRGESVQVRARLFDPRLAASIGDGVSVLVESADQPRRRLTLAAVPGVRGVYEGELQGLLEGSYSLLLVDPPPEEPTTARFSVVARPGELSRLEMDREALAAAAAETRGRFYPWSEAAALVEELPPGRRVPLGDLPPVPLWDRWWLLSLLLVFLGCEWVLRRRKGML